jgi:hypothetical protein
LHFIRNDKELLAALVIDDDARPSFDLPLQCLVWPDERPAGLSRMGYDLLCELWRIRAYIHRGLSPTKWGLNPIHSLGIWSAAQADQVRWPGFARLILSPEHQGLLEANFELPLPIVTSPSEEPLRFLTLPRTPE